MSYDRERILQHWNDPAVESMYDKHLLHAEVELIRQRIPENSTILDAGCGEGEGTFVYSGVPGTVVHAVDFSEARLALARQKLAVRENVFLKCADFLDGYNSGDEYDIIISERFLINLTEWKLQQKVLLDFVGLLKRGGRLLMLEGSRQGSDSLNGLRLLCGLRPLPVKWHNLYFDDEQLIGFMRENGCKLLEQDGLGTYFMLTRGIRPMLDRDLMWDCEFNRIAALPGMKETVGFKTTFSRLKLWVFIKCGGGVAPVTES